MPESSKPAQKRKATAFKPPPTASKPKASTGGTRRKSAPARVPAVSISSSEDELASSPAQESSDPSPARGPAHDAPPTIPPKLLTRILHHHFKKSDVRIGKDANALIGKYIDTFVREAIARATLERSEADDRGLSGEFLEVSLGLQRHLRASKGSCSALCRSKIWRSWLRN